MKPCRNPNCPREATSTVMIRGVGIRDLCTPCHESLTTLGMDLKPVDTAVPMPEWRRRTLNGQQRLLGVPR